MAQRVMDSGDAGHILLSDALPKIRSVQQLATFLHTSRKSKSSMGVRVHLFNLYTDEAGNAALPEKNQEGKAAALHCSQDSIAALIVVAVLAARPHPATRPDWSKPQQPESALTAVLAKRRIDVWIDGISPSQANNGGMKGSAVSRETTTQVWTTPRD